MTTDLTEAIDQLDERTAAVALERFVAANPHYDGAHWRDVIDELFNADAHLELTESCDTVESAVAAVTALWAGTLPTISTVCRVHLPSSNATPFVETNPLVGPFQEWLMAERIWSVPGTMSVGPHMFVADFPIEFQARIVAWFRQNGVTHGGER